MKHIRLFTFLPALVAGLWLAAPAAAFADRNVTVYRDRDGDGHYNKKNYSVNRGYYNGGHYYGRPYGYYGRPYGSYGGYYGRPYGYYGGGYPYHGYPGASLSITTYNRPAYSSYQRSYGDNLAVDVQRQLQRRGYYRGPIDGDVGPGTRAAIRAYQDDRGLSVNGRIDRSLLRSLGIG